MSGSELAFVALRCEMGFVAPESAREFVEDPRESTALFCFAAPRFSPMGDSSILDGALIWERRRSMALESLSADPRARALDAVFGAIPRAWRERGVEALDLGMPLPWRWERLPAGWLGTVRLIAGVVGKPGAPDPATPAPFDVGAVGAVLRSCGWRAPEWIQEGWPKGPGWDALREIGARSQEFGRAAEGGEALARASSLLESLSLGREIGRGKPGSAKRSL